MSLHELFYATLHGEDERLVARCDVPAIVKAIEDYGVYSVDALRSTLDVSLAALQLALGGSAAPAFLPLVKTKLESDQTQPATPRGGAFSTPPPRQPPFSAAGGSGAEQVPLVVTVKFNGRSIAERTTVFVVPTSTFEQVALARIQSVMGSEEAQKYAQFPLTVSVFRTADQLPSDRSAAWARRPQWSRRSRRPRVVAAMEATGQVATDWATARVWAAARAMGKDANGAAPDRFGGLYGRLVVLVRLVLVWAVLDAKLMWFQAILRSLFFSRSRGARAKEGVTRISESSYCRERQRRRGLAQESEWHA